MKETERADDVEKIQVERRIYKHGEEKGKDGQQGEIKGTWKKVSVRQRGNGNKEKKR